MKLITEYLRLEVLFIFSSTSFGAMILTVPTAISNNKQLHSKVVMQTGTTLLLLLFCARLLLACQIWQSFCCMSEWGIDSLLSFTR